MIENWWLWLFFAAGLAYVAYMLWWVVADLSKARLAAVDELAEMEGMKAMIHSLRLVGAEHHAAIARRLSTIEESLEVINATSSRNLEVTMAAHALIDEVDNGLATTFGEVKRDLTTLIDDRPKLMQIPQASPQVSYMPPTPGERAVTWNDLRRAGEAKRQRDLAATLAAARQEAQARPKPEPGVDWKYMDEAEPVPATAWDGLPTTPEPFGATKRTSAMDEIFKQAKETE